MSILNVEKKIVFIHIPKTGGTSMEDHGLLGTVTTRHFDIAFYENLVKDDLSINLDEFFKFAFVREPYDRVASAIWNHALKMKNPNRKDFNDFIVGNKDMQGS